MNVNPRHAERSASATYNDALQKAVAVVKRAEYITAFTGAGISVESGIPSFRGQDGLWSRYDPSCLDIAYFRQNPGRAWEIIREIFYDAFTNAAPNDAHRALALMESEGVLRSLITQNIDDLHKQAGSVHVHELHGSASTLLCMLCRQRQPAAAADLRTLPPVCACGGVYKPDFVFFGEMLPEHAHEQALCHAATAEVFLIIGTTGEVYPAALIPREASKHGACIIEINTHVSEYTSSITDIFIQEKASIALRELVLGCCRIDESTFLLS